MIKKRNITKDELTMVMLSCDWHNWAVRNQFAQQGYFLNILKYDKNDQVQWSASNFLAIEEFEKHQYEKKVTSYRRRY